MTASSPLLIVGASARAAAFSAARAGFMPCWIDQFGDADLAEAFAGVKLAPAGYPAGIPEAARTFPDMPFLYTGAMENHRPIIETLAAERELLGNDAGVCEAVRDPFRLQQCLRDAGLAAAAVSAECPADDDTAWLCKPLNSSGGLGIRLHDPGAAVPAGHYLQEFVGGRSVSAVYLGDGRRAQLAGVTRQLVGKAAFHAVRYAYCGSVGPLSLSAAEADQWRHIGGVLAQTFGLRGLFGVDAIEHDGTLIPVEINPRYTASVEVIETGNGLPLTRYHVNACRGSLDLPHRSAQELYGKCYLFAPEQLIVRGDPRTLPMPCELDSVKLADVPVPGTVIRQGAPVLSLHTWGRDQLECLQRLTARAAAVLETLL